MIKKRLGFDLSALCAVAAYPAAFFSYWLQGQLLAYPAFVNYVLPAVPWAVCVSCMIAFRTKALAAYWWVLPSVLPALASLIMIGVMMLAWSIGGFV